MDRRREGRHGADPVSGLDPRQVKLPLKEKEMPHAKVLTLAASVAALALSVPGTAAAAGSPPTVFNFGHCESSGFPVAQLGFGPIIFIDGGQPGFFAHVPPGQFNNAESGSIACGPNS
jgi:hypothetical protein